MDRNDRTFLSTQSILYRLAIVSLLSYFPSLALPKLASKRMLDTLATRRALASPTVFPSHYRKNGRFQTSAPALLKHSLSFTLQLFRPTIPPHADFDVTCDSAPEPRLAVPSLSSGHTKRPFSIASPVYSSTYLPGRGCLYAYRALYTDRPTYLIPIRAPGP